MGPAWNDDAILNANQSADGIGVALQGIADGVGAEGATLTYSYGATQIGAVFSQSLLEHVAAYVSPDRPVDPRPARVNPTLAEGFRLDQDDFEPEELDRDPYYQEFLRARGYGWHACALLAGAADRETVNLTIRRTTREGPFDQDQLASLSDQLPLVRATARITQIVGSFERTEPRPDQDLRRALFGWDARGSVFVVREGLGSGDILQVRRARLVARGEQQQRRLNATIDRANAMARQVSTILTDPAGDWWLFSFVPASMMAPSGMTTFISWAVLAPFERSADVDLARARHLSQIFGLSPAEARVAGLIGEAKSVDIAARLLSTSPGTIRNHLKSIFYKIGVSRQAELVAILSRF